MQSTFLLFAKQSITSLRNKAVTQIMIGPGIKRYLVKINIWPISGLYYEGQGNKNFTRKGLKNLNKKCLDIRATTVAEKPDIIENVIEK